MARASGIWKICSPVGTTSTSATSAAREAVQAGRELLAEKIEPHIAFTSVLRRAIRTLWLIQDTMDRMWIRSRAAGGSTNGTMGCCRDSQQGTDRRRSTARPRSRSGAAATTSLPRRWRWTTLVTPRFDARYAGVDPVLLPASESLKDTLARVLPFWESRIVPELRAGKNVLVVAHGNSLRALVKMLDLMSEADIVEFNIPHRHPHGLRTGRADPTDRPPLPRRSRGARGGPGRGAPAN